VTPDGGMTRERFDAMGLLAQEVEIRKALCETYEPAGVTIIFETHLKIAGSDGRTALQMLRDGDGWLLMVWADSLASGAFS